MRITLPKVIPTKTSSKDKVPDGFPLEHYSYSTFTRFSTNPIMFKINAINGDVIETTSTASNVLGRAAHKAMQTYFGANPEVATPVDEAEAIKLGYEVGRAFLDSYSDGLMHWNKAIPDRAKLGERFSFAYFEYIKALGHDPKKQETLFAEKMLKHRIAVDGHDLPVPLKGSADWVYREDGKIKLLDHKFTSMHSGDEKIDGAKLLQAAFNYFLVFAETGEAPYSITFAECKFTQNQDKSAPQVKRFTILYEDVPLMFDLFYRFYADVTDALLGKMVYVPNLNALYDNEVSLLAYIHHLDDTEERAKQLKKMKVDNITDFLRKKITRSKSLHKFMETTAQKFVSAATLNYATMTTEEKIKMKLAEYGIGLEFDSKTVGSAVTLYRYEPSIGVKMTKIEQYGKDIELVTASPGVRILAPIPGTETVGFEVPNKKRTFLGAAPKARLARIAVGVDVQGNTQYIDLREAPHVLIAGATGSGKSVLLNSMLAALGGSVELWLMDPKQVELQDVEAKRYADDPDTIVADLKDLIRIMEDRYSQMKKAHQKKWTGELILNVIDEYGDLMLSKRGNEIEGLILKLAAKARASGIHIILTTQSPRVTVVTGSIKANFPTRIALKTSSAKDSEVILGVGGAEKLCGKGDLLLIRSTEPEIVRLQGFAE